MAISLMSFADFERLDLGAGKTELLRGEVLHQPPAPSVEMDVCEALYEVLKAANTTPGKVHIFRGYRLPTDPASWLQPNVNVTHPGQPVDRYYIGAPLIAFEVVSEYDFAPVLDTKVATYLSNGSAEVWLFYPQQRHAWVYDNSGTARKETNSVHSALLPGVEIPFAEFL